METWYHVSESHRKEKEDSVTTEPPTANAPIFESSVKQPMGKEKRAFVKDDTRLKSAYLDMIDSRGNEVSIRIDNPEGSIEDYARRNLTQTLKTRLRSKVQKQYSSKMKTEIKLCLKE